MNRNNHEDNTNKARHNIYEYAQKNSEKSETRNPF